MLLWCLCKLLHLAVDMCSQVLVVLAVWIVVLCCISTVALPPHEIIVIVLVIDFVGSGKAGSLVVVACNAGWFDVDVCGGLC